jgi:hypothetical protein
MKTLSCGLLILLAGCGSKHPPAPPPLSDDRAAKDAFVQESGLEKSTMSPYIRGKVAVLNRKGKSLERGVQELLPSERNAATRDEVETVVWIDWSTVRATGIYYKFKEKNLYAVCWVADLTVIDWKKKLILGGPRISGPPPSEQFKPETVENVNEAEGVPGPRPYAEIARYLEEVSRSTSVPP